MPKNTTKRLRIGFVVDDGLDRPDGVQQYILTLGSWLEEQGHYVCYLAGETTRSDMPGVISLSKNLKVSFNGNRLSSPLPVWPSRIRKTLSEQELDILHVQMPYSPLMAAQIVKEANPQTKIVGTFHVLPVGRLQRYATKLLGYLLKRNLRKFDKFISVSAPAQSFARQTFGINSEVIPNPVNIKKYHQATKLKKTGTFNIVFLGRLVPRKGCIGLLEAVNILNKKKQLTKIQVHICGDGPQKTRLSAYVHANGLDKIVTFHGFVSEAEKKKYLAEADLAIFPSTGGESFGIVLIEAMAAGSGVVLAGNNPGYASVMEVTNECLFDPSNTTELAEKIDWLMKDSDKRATLHKAQQKQVSQFDVETIGQRLLDIYLGLGQNDTK